MLISPQMLSTMLPRCPEPQLEVYARELGAAAAEFEITTVTRLAAFCAQVAHESGELRWWEEKADGKAYEGRVDRGNTQPGDGPRFKGRGPLQITFRGTHRECGAALRLPIEEQPELLLTPEVGFRAAGWFWRWLGKPLSKKATHYLGAERDLNRLADRSDFRGITLAVNGNDSLEAPTYFGRRLEYYHRALEVLGVGAQVG